MCFVVTLNRYFSFFPTTSLHPVFVLILHPRDILCTNFMVTDCETEQTKQSQFIKVKQVKC